MTGLSGISRFGKPKQLVCSLATTGTLPNDTPGGAYRGSFGYTGAVGPVTATLVSSAPPLPAGWTLVVDPEVVTPATSLLNFDGTNGSTTFTDATDKTWTRSGTAEISTTQSKYGAASLRLPTISSGISTTAPIPSIMPGTDFCVEFWLRAGNTTGDIRVAAKVGGASGISQTNALLFHKSSGANGVITVGHGGHSTTSHIGFTDTDFGHVAFTVHHSGGGHRVRLFVNGVAAPDGAAPSPGNYATQINFGATSLWLGHAGTGRGLSNGFIDDFRLTVGSAVYTSNFTPPTAALTAALRSSNPGQVALAWPGPAAPGATPLSNLGFESGDTQWLKGSRWAIDTTGLKDGGTWSAKYDGPGQSTLQHIQAVPVTPGTSITASCRISKGNNREDFAGGAVVLQWLDAAYNVITFNVGNVVNTGTAAFQTSAVTAIAPAGSAFVRLAASGSRDVRGRARDKVYADNFVWNHSYAIPAPPGVTYAVVIRLRDGRGCEATLAQTI